MSYKKYEPKLLKSIKLLMQQGVILDRDYCPENTYQRKTENFQSFVQWLGFNNTFNLRPNGSVLTSESS